MTMNITTENASEKAGLLSRLWNPKPTAVSTISAPEPKRARAQAGTGKMSPKMSKVSDPKVKPVPTVKDLRLLLEIRDQTLCIGDIAEALELTMVQSSRLVSEAAKAGFVTKAKQGRFVYVRLVPIEKLRLSQLR